VTSHRTIAVATVVLALAGGAACSSGGSVDDAIAAAGSSTTSASTFSLAAPGGLANVTSDACLLTGEEIIRATGHDVVTSRSDAENTTIGVWMCGFLQKVVMQGIFFA